MTDIYRDTDERYLHDPAFHEAVKSLEAVAREHGFTPGELKQIAFKAALNIEETRPPGPIAIIGVRNYGATAPRTVTTVAELNAIMGWHWSEKDFDGAFPSAIQVIPVPAGVEP